MTTTVKTGADYIQRGSQFGLVRQLQAYLREGTNATGGFVKIDGIRPVVVWVIEKAIGADQGDIPPSTIEDVSGFASRTRSNRRLWVWRDASHLHCLES